MTDMDDNYSAFLEAVIPDVDQEVDRICMAVVVMHLQKLARTTKDDKKKYEAGVKKLWEALYGASSDDSSDGLHPALQLSYWIMANADYWKTVEPPTGTASAATHALQSLLEAARRIQGIIEHQQTRVEEEAKNPKYERDHFSEQLRVEQQRTINVVMGHVHPSYKATPTT